MNRPRRRELVVASALCIGVLAFPPHASSQSLPALDSLPPGVTMAMVEQGRSIFEGEGLCSTCHGADATGDVGPDLTDGDWLQAKGSFDEIRSVVTHGVPVSKSATGTAMPPRGDTDISDVEVEAVAAYVWRRSHPAAGDSLPPGVTAGLVERGEQVFLGAGGCALCHGEDATGVLGPDLTDDEWLDAKGSYLTIARVINHGVPVEASASGVEMPPRGGSDISGREVESVAAYVWYMSRRN